jgi:hypothetical protein
LLNSSAHRRILFSFRQQTINHSINQAISEVSYRIVAQFQSLTNRWHKIDRRKSEFELQFDVLANFTDEKIRESTKCHFQVLRHLNVFVIKNHLQTDHTLKSTISAS